MLDIKFIRDNPDVVKEAVRKKGIDFDVDKLLKVDQERRRLIQSIENLRKIKNQANKEIQNAKDEVHRLMIITQMQELDRNSDNEEKQLKEVEQEYEQLMLLVPNIPDESVPEGQSDADNIEIKKWGKIPQFTFPIKDHIQLAKELDLIDFERGVKVAGFRGYFLKREALMLCLAIWQYALELLIKKGFIPMGAPSLVKPEALIGTGYLPQAKDEVYATSDGMYLAGTSEVALMNYYANEILSEDDLPIKYAGFSPCFRTEIGSYGKDTQGILRVHEFMKIEQVVLCRNDKEESVSFHEEITHNAEEILQGLELPYHIVVNCAGDLGLGQVKKYDIECWVPSQNKYRETHSSSYFFDFQTRRLNIRYKTKSGEIKYAHSLNNTGIATPRILIPLLENNQQKDGSIKIPKVLHKYLNFKEIKRKI
ncbi:MAG TPA: serine--tRNA ligase [Candidatus Pacearchaeota archaeon]|jgi:seryl-tRNA synthetase|nr:serine--tRNA ligase [Candidatus Pacearchaeota archaeon]HRR94901.1 serine--tRNA ligase [Candidatus Paceibacterota bacterium]HPC30551.1 serine--tRNA ligase [Candidatus Pacearchaeota archaeon]HQG09368.1 serine--tRNA ligase [Candidatus Pacearchaeota archaeon]HQH20298.1 serine--tRNA ligase [Candidatus Pacearchaeota archaeon]